MRIRRTVGLDNAVAVEVVVGRGIAPVVASVQPYLTARQLALAAKSLVDEVPNEAALVAGILAYDVPVLAEAAHAVAHRMGILALDERAGIVALGILLAVAVVVVHGAVDVRLALLAGLFVLNGTTLVDGLNQVV